MRRFSACGLCLSLACCAAGRAEEVPWRTAGTPPPGPAAPLAAVAVSWHAPRAAAAWVEPGLLDASVRRAAFVERPALLPTSVAGETFEPPAGTAEPAATPEADAPPLPDYLPASGEEAEELALPRPLGKDEAPGGPPPSQAADGGAKASAEIVWHAPAEQAGCACAAFPEAQRIESPATPERLEVSGGFLLWWTQGSRLPPLVTTAPADAPGRGTLGAAGTAVLFGNQNADAEARPGGRLEGTFWIDPEQTLGIEAGGFLLGQASTSFAANSDGYPVLARPVFLVDSGAEGRQLLATPGNLPGEALQLHGQVAADVTSRLWGADAGFRGNLLQGGNWWLDVVGGFRYLSLDEGLHVSSESLSLRAVPGLSAFDVGNEFTVADGFDTVNHFYGGQVGLRGEWQRGRWTVSGQARVSLGLNQETVDIAGSRVFTSATGQQVQSGGLLALPSNSGRFSQDRFAVVPEVSLKLSYQMTDTLCAFVGYDFLYWANVVRPADQVDRSVDARQISGAFSSAPPSLAVPSHPLFAFHETGFWAQGVTAGLEWRY